MKALENIMPAWSQTQNRTQKWKKAQEGHLNFGCWSAMIHILLPSHVELIPLSCFAIEPEMQNMSIGGKDWCEAVKIFTKWLSEHPDRCEQDFSFPNDVSIICAKLVGAGKLLENFFNCTTNKQNLFHENIKRRKALVWFFKVLRIRIVKKSPFLCETISFSRQEASNDSREVSRTVLYPKQLVL